MSQDLVNRLVKIIDEAIRDLGDVECADVLEAVAKELGVRWDARVDKLDETERESLVGPPASDAGGSPSDPTSPTLGSPDGSVAGGPDGVGSGMSGEVEAADPRPEVVD